MLSKNLKTILIYFVIFAVLSLLSFASTLQGGTLAYNDFSLIYRYEQLGRAFQFPWDHMSNLGSPNFLVGNAFYNILMVGLSGIIGSVTTGHKLLLIILVSFSGLGFASLVGYFLHSRVSALAAGIYGMFNFWVFQRIEFGHNTMLLGYCLLPYVLLFSFKGIDRKHVGYLLLAGIMAGLLFIADPHMAYMFYMMIAIYLLVELILQIKVNVTSALRNSVLVLLVIGLGLSLSLPFLYPSVTVKEPVYIFRSEEVTYYTANPALIKPSDMPHDIIATVIFALSFALIALKGFRKERYSIYFLSLTIIGITLSMGGLWPLSVFYVWLFENLPGFVMFREANKFLLFPAVALCFFTGKLAHVIYNNLLGKLESIRSINFRAASLLPLIIGLVLLSGLVVDSYSRLAKTVEIPQYQGAYDDWLYSQNDDYRIACIPAALWATRYTWADHGFLNPAVAEQPKPTVEVRSELDATLSASFVKWVYASVYQGKTDEIGALFGLMGVRYLVVREDATIPQFRDDFKLFSKSPVEIIEKGKGLEVERSFGPVMIYRVEHTLPMIFPTKDSFLAYGDRRLLITLAHGGWDYESNAILFADNLGGQGGDTLHKVSGIIVEGDRYWDLITSWLGEKYVTETWRYGALSTDGLSNWVIGDLTWYWLDGALNVNPGKYIMTYGDNEITIPMKVGLSGRYLVLIQTYIDSANRFKGLDVSVAGHPSIEVKPSNVVEGRYVWLPVGYYSLSSENAFVKLRSLGGIAAVSKVAVLPEEMVKLAEHELSSFLKSSDKELVFVLDDYIWAFASDPSKSIRKTVGASNGIMIDLENSKLQASLYVPKGGYYKVMARMFRSDNIFCVDVCIDENQLIILNTSERGFSSVVSKSFYLGQGEHTISLSGEGFIDFLTVFSASMNMPTVSNGEIASGEIFSYETYSSSKYTVTLDGENFIFLETYSENWILEGNGNIYTPLPVYGFANIYLVENEALTRHTLYYIGAKDFEIGLLLSIVASPVLGLAILGVSNYCCGKKPQKIKSAI